MRLSVRILMVAALALTALMSFANAHGMRLFSSEDDHYCGVPAYPKAIPELPAGREDARLVRVLNFIRHGDRSPAGSHHCWNVLEPQPFNFCSSKLHSTPSILNDAPRENAPFNQETAVTFPLLPINDAGFYPGTCYVGQLSDKGHWMSYNNGRRVGNLYKNEWKKAGFDLTSNHMRTRTTDVPRTKESAESFMTGVLDVAYGDKVSQAPVPVMGFTDVGTDPVRLGVNVCPLGAAYVKESYASPEYKEYIDTVLTPLQNELKVILKMESVDVNTVFDCLKVHICQDLNVPAGITRDLDARITAHATHYWNFALLRDPIRAAKFLSGPLLIEIYSQLVALAAEGETGRFTEAPELRLYSGHDHGPMMNLAAALRIQEIVRYWPPYSAMLNFEIADLAPAGSAKASLMIRTVYQGEVINLPFCSDKVVDGGYCPINVVMNYLKPLLPTQAECPGMRTPNLDFLTQDGKSVAVPVNAALAMGLGETQTLSAEMQAFAAPLVALNQDFKAAQSQGHPIISDMDRWTSLN